MIRRCLVAALSFAWVSQAHAAPVLEQVAREGSRGVGVIDDNTTPAIADDGTVVFFTQFSDPNTLEAVHFAAEARPLHSTFLLSEPLTYVRSLDVDAHGNAAFVGNRQVAGVAHHGVYRVSEAAGLEIVYQTVVDDSESDGTDVVGNVGLSSSGVLAFSTFHNSLGALYRQLPGAGLERWNVLRDFAASIDLDVNDAGEIAAQLEYIDPAVGFSRGIFVFDRADQPLRESFHAIRQLPNDNPIRVAYNARGEVAYALNAPATLRGDVARTLEPGVYISRPTLWGEPNELVRFADLAGAYARFGKVVLDDSGRVVFEAELEDGTRGIYYGPDPTFQRVVSTGMSLGGVRIMGLSLGNLNQRGQLTFRSSGDDGAIRRIWRASCIPRAGPISPRVAGPVLIANQDDVDALRCVDAIDGDLTITADSAPMRVRLPNLREVTGNIAIALPLRPAALGVLALRCDSGTSSSQRRVELDRLTNIGGDLSISAPNTLADVTSAQPVELGFASLYQLAGDLTLTASTGVTLCGFPELDQIEGDLRISAPADLYAPELLARLRRVAGAVELADAHTTHGLLRGLEHAGSLSLRALDDGIHAPMVMTGDNLEQLREVDGGLSLSHVSWPRSFAPFGALASVGGTLRLHRVSELVLDQIGLTTGVRVAALDVDATAMTCITSPRADGGCSPINSATSPLLISPKGTIRFAGNRSLSAGHVCAYVELQRSRGFTGGVDLDHPCIVF